MGGARSHPTGFGLSDEGPLVGPSCFFAPFYCFDVGAKLYDRTRLPYTSYSEEHRGRKSWENRPRQDTQSHRRQLTRVYRPIHRGVCGRAQADTELLPAMKDRIEQKHRHNLLANWMNTVPYRIPAIMEPAIPPAHSNVGKPAIAGNYSGIQLSTAKKPAGTNQSNRPPSWLRRFDTSMSTDLLAGKNTAGFVRFDRVARDLLNPPALAFSV